MVLLRAFVLGSLLAAAAAEQELPFKVCGEDKLGVEKLVVSEFPLQPGHEISFAAYFKPTEEIAGGKLSLALSVRNVKLFETTVDMCQQGAIQCPLPAGQEVTASTTQTLPQGAPPAKLQVLVTGKDTAGAELTCVEVEVELGGAPGLSVKEMGELPAISSSLLADIAMAPESRTWKPHWSPRFANATLKQAASMMGTVLRGHPMHLALPAKTYFRNANETIPETFDAREQWPHCKDVIGHVRDQSACGSCWAFASTAAFNDRLCIARNVTDFQSVTDTLACCTGASCGFSLGCNGGQPAGAWSFFTEAGTVTGGDNTDVGTGATCLPYPFPACAHHVEPSEEYPACPEEDYETPRCRMSCSEREYEGLYLADKSKGKRAYAVRRSVEDIQREIMENGPVSAAFSVYQDFLTYSGGVYQHATGMPLGGHAVKIVGWGVDNGTPFWTIINSWNPTWGEGGSFRMIRGVNECGIEDDVTAGY